MTATAHLQYHYFSDRVYYDHLPFHLRFYSANNQFKKIITTMATARINVAFEDEELAQHNSRKDAVALMASKKNSKRDNDWWEMDHDEIVRINYLFEAVSPKSPLPSPSQSQSPSQTPTMLTTATLTNSPDHEIIGHHAPTVPMIGHARLVADGAILPKEDPAVTQPIPTASTYEEADSEIGSQDVEKFLENPSLKSDIGGGGGGGDDSEGDLVAALSEDIYSLIFTAKLCCVSFYFAFAVFGIQGGILVLICKYRIIHFVWWLWIVKFDRNAFMINCLLQSCPQHFLFCFHFWMLVLDLVDFTDNPPTTVRSYIRPTTLSKNNQPNTFLSLCISL